MYCKDCKFWKAHTDQWRDSWTECDQVGGSSREGTLSDDDFAIYADADDNSGLEVGLKTGPMFGCIKFVGK
jgi:hypothetical protein